MRDVKVRTRRRKDDIWFCIDYSMRSKSGDLWVISCEDIPILPFMDAMCHDHAAFSIGCPFKDDVHFWGGVVHHVTVTNSALPGYDRMSI